MTTWVESRPVVSVRFGTRLFRIRRNQTGRQRLQSAGSSPRLDYPQAPSTSETDYDPSVIEPGSSAPDFTLPDADGQPVSLSDLRGQAVVLYFYPKADTPGCTVQACGVRDRRADYERAGAAVLGVSPDPVAKVKRFRDKHGLDFTLLADEQH